MECHKLQLRSISNLTVYKSAQERLTHVKSQKAANAWAFDSMHFDDILISGQFFSTKNSTEKVTKLTEKRIEKYCGHWFLGNSYTIGNGQFI